MITSIKKRDGRVVPFDQGKIEQAIEKAFMASGSRKSTDTAHELANQVVNEVERDENVDSIPTVEQVQDTVERVLIEKGFVRSAKAYILYRAERSRVREMNTRLMKVFEDITYKDAVDSDIKRENANINGDTAMGSMLKFGSEGAKQFYNMYVLDPRFSKAHSEGDIHIHDLDFYTLTTTCCQIDLLDLFHNGFSTGHGVLREPNDIYSYSALACIAIQANQNDQHGGQSVVNFDYGMAPGVQKTYYKRFRDNLARAMELLGGLEDAADKAREILAQLEEEGLGQPHLADDADYDAALNQKLIAAMNCDETVAAKVIDFVRSHAHAETDKATYQAMEALIHNLNTMNSRAGAQVPFSSINYGMDTSPEGRMVMRNVMLATEAGLGNGETPIFPIQIFRVKEGVSFNPGDPNYDLYRLAIRTSAKRLFPNFSFVDAPFNLQYYKEGHPETEIAYMGCRTRVIGNVYDPERQVSPRRGNLSFTSINLPRIAIKAKGDITWFFEELERTMDLVRDQLLERLEIISKKKVRNFPFLMGEGVWIDSENLDWDDSVAEVLKHGTLSIGFIGLAETLVALRGKHHGEDPSSQNLGLEIVGAIRNYCDEQSKKYKLNFTCLATPAEGLSGRFVRIDKEKFGVIKGITDRDYYTNSFHVPVYYATSAFDKIRLEAPYHALTNAGHISYIEMDGDPTQNLDAFEKVVRYMHDQGIGYGSINHPVDRDPDCGYNGIIGDSCPKCGRKEEDGHPFDRIRRITGYLVGNLNRFNNAKRKEESERVKHSI
ncbi:MAG: anaerobic ribonucleoside triphosphate reductase [Clostridiales bacterium]|nr:anaerobic ribonucleoside triphosphate reductase [Clostridiales bacterium]